MASTKEYLDFVLRQIIRNRKAYDFCDFVDDSEQLPDCIKKLTDK